METTQSGGRKARRPLTFAKKIELAIRSVPVVVVLCLLACVSFGVIKKLFKPILIYRVEAAEISEIQKELTQLKSDNAYLRKQTKYLRTSKGAQTEARKMGYVYPGEVSIVIEHPQSDKAKE